MKTKLIYVLTSAPDNNYCEQALMSVFTARHHNPDAYILLIVDDLTDKLFVGVRTEILNYISEKLVIPLNSNMSLMERSRWLKTSVRNLVQGDLLFIDCDTLITRSLENIDNCTYELGAVLESHLPIKEFNKLLYEQLEKNSKLLDWDAKKENYYFSSGVIFAKDSEKNKLFFEKWNSYWFEGTKKGVKIDQPSFAKANIELNRPIQKLDDIWNCVMYTHPTFDRDAKILHFCSFRNMSYVFSDQFLNKVNQSGVNANDFVKYSILNPYASYIPFDNAIYRFKLHDYFLLFKNIHKTSKLLSRHLEASFDDFLYATGIEKYIKSLFGAESPQYKQVSKIKFTRPKR